jgi:hypothetical protein
MIFQTHFSHLFFPGSDFKFRRFARSDCAVLEVTVWGSILWLGKVYIVERDRARVGLSPNRFARGNKWLVTLVKFVIRQVRHSSSSSFVKFNVRQNRRSALHFAIQKSAGAFWLIFRLMWYYAGFWGFVAVCRLWLLLFLCVNWDYFEDFCMGKFKVLSLCTTWMPRWKVPLGGRRKAVKQSRREAATASHRAPPGVRAWAIWWHGWSRALEPGHFESGEVLVLVWHTSFMLLWSSTVLGRKVLLEFRV